VPDNINVVNKNETGCHTELTGDQRGDYLAIRCLDLYAITDMGEDLGMAHGYERKLAKIRMSRKVFQSMQLIHDENHLLGVVGTKQSYSSSE
jgi:hypothetical protein